MTGDNDWPLGNPHTEDEEPEVPPPVATKPQTIEERMAGVDVIDLRHADQEKVSDTSVYRVECPFCVDGLFLVARDQDTQEILDYDKCLGCGQYVRWIDIADMRRGVV